MNTINYAQNYQRSIYPQALAAPSTLAQLQPQLFEYDGYSPGGQSCCPGIYNRNQLWRAVQGQNRCQDQGYGRGIDPGLGFGPGHDCGSSPWGSGFGPGPWRGGPVPGPRSGGWLPRVGREVGRLGPRPAPQPWGDGTIRGNRALTRLFNKTAGRNPQGENAVGRLAGDDSRSTLVDLLGKNDLVGAVQGLEKKGPVTVLAPSNKAFADLAKKQPELFKKLTDPRNKEALKEVLLYHVSGQKTDFKQGGVFDSVLSQDQARFFGNPFSGQLVNGDQRINTGTASVSANGSVVIPVDQVLIPPGFDPSKLL